MKFFADHNVPEPVCKYLESRGHEVLRLKDVLPTDSPDPMVASVAEKEGAILISHDGDFRQIAPRIPKGMKQRFRSLSRIQLACRPTRSLERVEAAATLIQFEWEVAQTAADPRMHIVIQDNGIKTHR